jgi:hypothetical protein
VKNLAEVEKVNPYTVKELAPIETIGTSGTAGKPVIF